MAFRLRLRSVTFKDGRAPLRVFHGHKPAPINHDAIQLMEGVLDRLRSGEVVAVGLVEVKQRGVVGTAYSAGTGWYHELSSGAATLAVRFATESG